MEVTDAGDASNVFVKGLEGKTYIDKALDIAARAAARKGETLTFGDGVGLFDRVFLATEPETLLHVGTGAAVAVENTAGWTDTVVWNPHETLPGDAWKRFVCVESARSRRPSAWNGRRCGERDQPVRRQPVRRRRISRRIPVFDERVTRDARARIWRRRNSFGPPLGSMILTSALYIFREATLSLPNPKVVYVRVAASARPLRGEARRIDEDACRETSVHSVGGQSSPPRFPNPARVHLRALVLRRYFEVDLRARPQEAARTPPASSDVLL